MKIRFPKLPLAAALLLATAAAHAQQGGTAHFWFAPPGSMADKSAALTTLDISSPTFTLDIMYGDNVPQVSTVQFELHLDSSKLAVARVENVLQTAISPQHDSPHFTATAYADYQSRISPLTHATPDDNDPATDALLYPAWIVFTGSLPDKNLRLATITFQWKPGAHGKTTLHFTSSSQDFNIAKTTATSLTITPGES